MAYDALLISAYLEYWHFPFSVSSLSELRLRMFLEGQLAETVETKSEGN